jgi:uncharacterized protein (DUF1697 family)
VSRYVALIRGINVTGNNLIKMERLRALFEKNGCTNVRTYIQSGNVVFDSKKAASRCAASIEAFLAAELGKPITAHLRTSAELREIIAANPFAKEKDIEPSRLAVSFLSGPPAKDRLDALNAVVFGSDLFVARGSEIYVYCPDGFGRSKLAAGLDRVLSTKSMSRNWNTVTTLYELSILQV